MIDESKPIAVLAIESSCDETACAVVQKRYNELLVRVVVSTTATSLVKHKITKGIVPEVAAREQLKYILPVIEETIKGHKHLKLDAIAITVGPGLVGSLLVGIETARTLAMAWDLPVIPVNHVQAHPYANFVQQDWIPANTGMTWEAPQFPILSWVISGGHTELYLMNSHENIQRLGGTVDDAAGECFDKCARVLGFDYPGGPFIERLSLQYQTQDPSSQQIETPSISTSPQDDKIKLPRPLLYEKTLNMSFSGLKTAFLRACKENDSTNDSIKAELAHELQEAITDIIAKRTQQALTKYPEIKSVIISGGVASNKRLREKLGSLVKKYSDRLNSSSSPLPSGQGLDTVSVISPPLSLCTDNAMMIGAYAAFHFDKRTSWKNIRLQLKLSML